MTLISTENKTCSPYTTTKRKLQRPRAAESSIASQLNKKKANWELLDCVPSQSKNEQGDIRVFPVACGQTEVACEKVVYEGTVFNGRPDTPG